MPTTRCPARLSTCPAGSSAFCSGSSHLAQLKRFLTFSLLVSFWLTTLPSNAEPLQRQTPQPPYQMLEISGVSDQQALRANNGTFSVTILLQPALKKTHQLQLILDGQPYGLPGSTREIQLEMLDRGEHSLAVQVIEGTQVLQRSQPLRFYLLRAHRR